ncbi:MAG: hypothetical protein E5Y10_24430 [Mesorhizobium sp.]|nr:MAG: hypothetical protein E5Y10_24430 [Mesorhizobium sp.]
MRLFVDTEFNGFGGELLSMAVVSEDGREWYETLPLPEDINPWVAEHVVPLLGREPLAPNEWRRSLHRFLRQFDNPEVVADWYTDLVHFFNSMAGRDHTESFTFACRSSLVLLDNYASEQPHNALSDARAIRDALVYREAA